MPSAVLIIAAASTAASAPSRWAGIATAISRCYGKEASGASAESTSSYECDALSAESHASSLPQSSTSPAEAGSPPSSEIVLTNQRLPLRCRVKTR